MVNRPGLLAIVERLINRAAVAVVNLGLVFVATPHEVGLYASVLVMYSLVQSIGDLAVRQTAAPLWWYYGGERTIRRAGYACAALSMVSMSIFALVWLALGLVDLLHAGTVALMGLAGVFAGLALPRVTAAQARGAWALVARRQAVASAVSLVAGLGLLPFIGVSAGFTQVVVAEFMLLWLLPPATSMDRLRESPTPAWRQISAVSFSNLLGWLQVQTERVVVGAWGGGALLGIYSTSYQLARSLADPAGTGLLIHLRNSLSASPDRESAIFDAAMRRAAWAGLAIQVGVIGAVIIPMSFVLPSVWSECVTTAIVMTASLPLVLPMMSMSTILIAQARTKDLYPLQVLGVAMSVGCGAAFTASLLLGAAAVVVRDLVATAGRLTLVRRSVGCRSVVTLTVTFMAGLMIAGVTIAVV